MSPLAIPQGRRDSLRKRRPAWILWALSAGLTVTWGTLYVSTGQLLDHPTRPFALIGGLAGASLGAFLVARRPKNPIGWLIVGSVLLGAFVEFCYAYFLHPAAFPGELTFLRLGLALEGVPGLVAPLLFLLFPNGLLSWRWAAVAGTAIAAKAFLVAMVVATPDAPYGTLGVATTVIQFYGPGSFWGAATHWALRLFTATIVVGAVSLAIRFRRGGAEERQQLKWFVSAAALWAIFSIWVAEFLFRNDLLLVGAILQFLLSMAILAALGVAILKYRLYAIDVILNKALVYGALAAMVTALYVVVVAGLGRILGLGSEPNLGLSVVVTAAVALGFQPARERMQRLANRVVYGKRATPYEVIAGFARRMESSLSVDEVLPRMAEAACRGVGAERGRVRVLLPDGKDRSVSWPEGSVVKGFDLVVPVAHRGEALGEIGVAKPRGEPLTPAEAKLLEDLAAQAGPVMRNVALTMELENRVREISRQARELRASRHRIVEAADRERRRVERDLHDGAQQRLVNLSLAFQLARSQAGPNASAELMDTLERTAAELRAALSDLRELARGIHPAILTEEGLGPALASLAERSAVPATVTITADDRFSAPVEETAYFVVSEALVNAAKHSGASEVLITTIRADGRLVVEVSDDGVGGADVDGGTGLRGLTDRVAAVDGTLRVESPRGGGTRVLAEIPCA